MAPVRRTSAALILVLTGALLVGACGDDAEQRGSGAQPAPGTETLEQGLFDEIPRFPRSEPLGPRSEEAGVVAQSFRARDASPQQILDFYTGNLEGWNLVTPPQPPGETASTLRGEWAREQWLLTITASPAPTVEGDNATAIVAYSQYSLSLRRGDPPEPSHHPKRPAT